MSGEFNIKLNSFQEEAKRLGVKRPPVTRETVDINGVITNRLNAESEKDWSDYLRAVTMAKLALRQ